VGDSWGICNARRELARSPLARGPRRRAPPLSCILARRCKKARGRAGRRKGGRRPAPRRAPGEQGQKAHGAIAPTVSPCRVREEDPGAQIVLRRVLPTGRWRKRCCERPPRNSPGSPAGPPHGA
jgi:hypothetical protein